jgi:predicted PurR-regulated permease PerM
MEQQSILNINWGTIFKICLAVICLYIVYLIRDIVVWFIFALVISILFNFLVDPLEKKRIPRVVGATVSYFGIFVLLSFFIYKTAPILLSEIKGFTQNIPQYLQQISPLLQKFGILAFRNTQSLIETLEVNLDKVGGNIFNALFSIFGGVFSTIFIISLAFFISLEKDLAERILITFSPSGHHEYLRYLLERSKKKVGGWFISRIIGVLFVGVATYIILKIFNVEYAFILSLLACIFDLVPIVGPILAGLIITFIVALTSLFQALFVLSSFIIIQILESNLVLPLLFKKFVGMPPALVLVALAVGGKLWGILGAVLVVPLAGIIFEVLGNYLERKKGTEGKEKEATIF